MWGGNLTSIHLLRSQSFTKHGRQRGMDDRNANLNDCADKHSEPWATKSPETIHSQQKGMDPRSSADRIHWPNQQTVMLDEKPGLIFRNQNRNYQPNQFSSTASTVEKDPMEWTISCHPDSTMHAHSFIWHDAPECTRLMFALIFHFPPRDNRFEITFYSEWV